MPPVFILINLKGGIPKLIGIGKSQGTPSLVKVSVIKCEINPIIKAYQTIFISTKTTLLIAPSKNLSPNPNRITPNREWEINLCPPKTGDRIRLQTPPAGSLFQRLAVG